MKRQPLSANACGPLLGLARKVVGRRAGIVAGWSSGFRSVLNGLPSPGLAIRFVTLFAAISFSRLSGLWPLRLLTSRGRSGKRGAGRIRKAADGSRRFDGTFGLNVVGYLRSELGVGQSARLCINAADAAGIPNVGVDFSVGCPSRANDRSVVDRIARRPAHTVTVAHVNADQFPLLLKVRGTRCFDGRYTIGYWAWELPDFPDEWCSCFDFVDEVWVPARFVQSAISAKSPVPVECMPHPIGFRSRPNCSRATFGLPDEAFLFLMMYDMHSQQARKNPAAAVEAFRRVSGHLPNAGLVVKTMNSSSNRKAYRRLKEAVADLPEVILIDQTLSGQDVYDLESVCDAYVSLHRSEGFGLVLAESMYLGKPVICTNWSGNTDFTNSQNACTVNYEIVELDQDHGPYRQGQHWAEPDIEHAAWYMRKLVEDPTYYARIARAGQVHIREQFSYGAVGRLYLKRLAEISQRHAIGNPEIVIRRSRAA